MPELDIPYRLTGPGGTAIVFGAGDLARADPDWVGYLDRDNPISISREVRGQYDALVEGDGGLAVDKYHGPASLVIRATLDPNAAAPVLTALEDKIKRATYALRGDAILRYTPTGSQERAYWLRRTADPDFQGWRPRSLQLAFESANAYALSPAESNAVIIPGTAGGELGFSSPLTSPIASPYNVTGSQIVTNVGTVATWPRFRILGPITNPRVVNNTTGQEARFTYTLNAGEWLDVYPALGRVLLGGVTDRYSAYDRPNSRWWQLQPGPNDIRLLASAFSAGASLTVYWRNAWE
jgi:hypothetical protein